MSLSLEIPSSTEGRAALVAAGLLGTVWAGSSLYSLRRRRQKSAIRARKQQECRENISSVADRIKQDKEAQSLKATVCSLPASELVSRIKSGQLTAVQVLHAFQAKALEAHEATNCVCWFFPEAEEQARAADANSKKEGLLYGLPISVKDHFSIKGHDSTYGIADGCFHPYERDCYIIEVLKSHGAIPFVRTNTPQLMLSFECGNPLFGYTTNPHDSKRGPGGSSGGEGAITGYGASPLGVGSDIGGSIRMPSSLCGVYGFKPTSKRLSKRLMPRYNYGQTLVDETFGPMSPSMCGVELMMQCLWDGQMSDWDLKEAPLPFNYKMFEDKGPLKIGYYPELDVFPAVPAMKRGVLEAVQALKAKGHTLVEWQPPRAKEAVLLEFEVLMAHGGSSWLNDVRYDALDPSIKHMVGSLNKPMWWRKLMEKIICPFLDASDARLVRAGTGLGSVLDWWAKVEEVMDYRDSMSDAWREAGLDVVIGPVFPLPAMFKRKTHKVETEELYLAGGVYTMLYNTLDQPAGVVPVSKVNSKDIQDMINYPSNSSVFESIQEGMKGAEGLPVCVQVIAPRYRDEKALRVMKELATSLPHTT